MQLVTGGTVGQRTATITITGLPKPAAGTTVSVYVQAGWPAGLTVTPANPNPVVLTNANGGQATVTLTGVTPGWNNVSYVSSGVVGTDPNWTGTRHANIFISVLIEAIGESN